MVYTFDSAKLRRKVSSRRETGKKNGRPCVCLPKTILRYRKKFRLRTRERQFSFYQNDGSTAEWYGFYFSKRFWTRGPMSPPPVVESENSGNIDVVFCLFYVLHLARSATTKGKDPSDYAVIRAYCLLRLIAIPIIVRIDWRTHKRYAWHVIRPSKKHTTANRIWSYSE